MGKEQLIEPRPAHSVHVFRNLFLVCLFGCLLACLLVCLFVCLFDMLSFLSETQFAYGPRAPRQSGYRNWGSYWHCQAGPPQACEQFHRKFKRDLWSAGVPTSPYQWNWPKEVPGGHDDWQPFDLPNCSGHEIGSGAPTLWVVETQIAPACLLAPCMDAWKITMIMVDLLKCFILPRCNNLFIFWLYHDSFCLILEVIFGILVHLKDFTKTHVRL